MMFIQVLKELTSLSDIKLDSTVVKYHKPCYRAYTSKQNLKPFLQSEVLDDCDRGSSSLTSSIIKTVPSVFRRSDWSSCIFCKFKTHKNDHKLHLTVGLNSSQEEADTRIILHALNMSNQFKDKNVMGRIVIKSPDTDVLVLLVHYFSRMSNTSELWFQTGTITALKDGRRYIPVHDLCKSLSAVLCRILPAAHALTGCDTTSAMFGIGKKSVYKLLKESPDEFKDLCKLGDSDVETAVDASRKLVSNLYDQKGKSKKCHSDLNKLRFKLSTSKDCSLVRLPPCESLFLQHVLRSILQTKIWMTADQAKPVLD
jgi:hypothetical protein